MTEAAARPGWLHAVTRRDVLRFLRRLDPDLLYGVREIALVRAPMEAGGAGPLFARYVSTGRIELFEQPMPPWFVRGRLPTAEARRLQHAGAPVVVDHALGTTRIDWQPAALRKFFLREVLLHELGHHRLQHEKGKRPTRIARTRDRLVNPTSAILIGDSIENPANARVMMAAARMFGVDCAFANTAPADPLGNDGGGQPTSPDSDGLPLMTVDAAAAGYGQVIACDNLPNARELYGFRAAAQFALLVGNERRGLTYSSRRIATDAVQIPMQSRRINCLNVAAAAAVALNYLTRIRVGAMARVADPATRRPEVLLAGATDHVELGSAIRSSAGFGWSRLLIDDSFRVWFGVDRIVRSEGRAAARRARNDIRLIPIAGHDVVDLPEVVVVTVASAGIPLHRLDLSRGPRQLIVIPDESTGHVDPANMERNGRRLRVASLDLTRHSFPYHYRLIASLVLAEVARQVGVRAPREGRRKARPEYMFQLPVSMGAAGVSISPDELAAY